MSRVTSARQISAIVAAVSLGLAGSAPQAFGSATGLNNIPTADVVGEREVVLQQWSDYGSNQVPEHFVGVKAGPVKNLEVGLDAKVGAASLHRGPVMFQAKYRFAVGERLAVAGGFVGLSGDSKRTGKIMPYVVASGHLGWFRAHVGFEARDDNEGPFGGVDRSFAWLNRATTLRADVQPVNAQRDVLWSVGFIQELAPHLLVEGWYNASSDPARDESVILKLDLAWRF